MKFEFIPARITIVPLTCPNIVRPEKLKNNKL